MEKVCHSKGDEVPSLEMEQVVVLKEGDQVVLMEKIKFEQKIYTLLLMCSVIESYKH